MLPFEFFNKRKNIPTPNKQKGLWAIFKTHCIPCLIPPYIKQNKATLFLCIETSGKRRQFFKGTVTRLVSLIRFLLQNHGASVSCYRSATLSKEETSLFVRRHKSVSGDGSFSQLLVTHKRWAGMTQTARGQEELLHEMSSGDNTGDHQRAPEKAQLSSHRKITFRAGNFHVRCCMSYSMLSLWMILFSSSNRAAVCVCGGVFTICKLQNFKKKWLGGGGARL